MKDVIHIILWIFIGALVVLVLTHGSGFSKATTAVGGQVTNDAFLLTGAASGKKPIVPASFAKA